MTLKEYMQQKLVDVTPPLLSNQTLQKETKSRRAQ